MVSPTVYARRSLCHLLNDQPDAALRDAMQAQWVYPDCPTSFYMQAVTLSKLNMDKDASDMLNLQLIQSARLDVSLSHRTVVQCSWVRPDVGWVCINTDGSLQAHLAGFGCIIRDSEGVVLAAAAGSTTPSSITMHELEAVEMGLNLAQQKQFHNVSVATDSMATVRLINGPTAPPWHLINLLRRIEHLRSSFSGFRIHHVYRETNQAADLLSKLLPSQRFVELVPSSFAEDLKKIVFDDKNGRIYDRM